MAQSLEASAGTGLYLGSWYDRNNGDTPSKTNARLDYKPLSFFQSDINISSTLQSNFLSEFIEQVEATDTDAFVYLTVYPHEGFDVITDDAIKDLCNILAKVTAKGRKVMIRYASEMNGSWFKYSQTPKKFLSSWKHVVTTVRKAVGRENVSFLWSPNSANGYPFLLSGYAANISSPDFDDALDTNKDGKFDINDDPYTPYYPGDEYVDWVGMSVYHYGIKYPWDTNVIPEPGKVEAIITGKAPFGNFHFYDMFSGNKIMKGSKTEGGKPFMLSESAATVHLAVQKLDTVTNKEYFIQPRGTEGQMRLKIKRSWWNQIFNRTFLDTYPNIKGISLFEFVKFEETSWRDFTILGKSTEVEDPFANDTNPQAVVLEGFRQDLKDGLGEMIKWSSKITKVVGHTDAENSGYQITGFHFLTFMFLVIIFE